MILCIFGDDSFRSREFLRKSINEFKQKRDPQGLNTLIFDVSKEAPDRIFSEITAAPFLAEKRMVVLLNTLSNNDKDFLHQIIVMIEEKKIPDSAVLVFWQSEAVGKTTEAKKLSEILSKEKYSYNFEKMDVGELVVWIVKEVKDRGGKIDRMAATFIAQNSGSDIWLVNSLLDQLISYKSGAEIRSEDARLFIEEKIDDSIFNLVDAIVSGDKKAAYKMIKKQRQIGQEDAYIFSMILRQFKILMQLRDLWERGDNLTSEQLAKTLKLHSFVVKKSMPFVRRFSMDQLKKIFDELLDVDVKTKTGVISQPYLIDFFVGKI